MLDENKQVFNLPMNHALFRNIERRNADHRNLAQAVPRPTRVRFFVAVGPGETRLIGADALTFTTFFLEKPTLSFGLELTSGDPGAGNLPLGTATVITYIQDEHDLYTGAEMGFRVDGGGSIDFSLTFEGHALRMKAKSA